MKPIHFTNKSYEDLQASLVNLNRRYKTVRLFKKLKNGLYCGWFEVQTQLKPNKKPKPLKFVDF